MPAVTVATRMLTSRRLSLASASVVKRNAPSSTLSAARNKPPRSGCRSSSLRDAFSPSFTRLPSASLMYMREPAPVFTSSPPRNCMPGASGMRRMPPLTARSTQAGICTPSTTAAGAAAACWAATASSAANRIPNRCFMGPPLARYVALYGKSQGVDALESAASAHYVTHAAPIRAPEDRAGRAGLLGGAQILPFPGGAGQAQVLLPVHVPLPVGEAAHGARQELHDRRRPHALPPHARHERAAADGLGRLRPARGERGDGEQGAAREVDLRQHRLHEAPAAGAGLRARLGARARRPAGPSTTSGTSGCSRACSRRASPTGRRASSTGTRWTRRCSPTSR